MPAPNSKSTSGIVLKRINFGEADRILTIITPDQGKLSLIAKGVRKEKSKLAGGIELFSVSSISFIPAKKEIGTLTSSRLVTHYGEIVKDIERTNTAYAILTTIDSVTQDNCDIDYYNLLLRSISALNNPEFNLSLIEAWFYMNLIMTMGHEPNLTTDREGYSLAEASNYAFDQDDMCFVRKAEGSYNSRHIKLMRLLADETIERINVVGGVKAEVGVCLQLLQHIMQTVS
ncbi:MAG TPA: DNA repair protein RecO [Candidatus Saccharibacteria bacterium]|nr:DNA repair protein RecO [Candidatus Saccharibacteria bacterium]